MSNLPHPNDDASAGDLWYPGSPTVTVADSPGAGGSRAVEFGEDGYSLAVNRMGYALGKNDEYQQARLEAPIARPTFTNFVPSGGSGVSYQFSSINMFVGDATYLPETQTIRDSLISVLDSRYTDLLDTNGHKVVVKELKNAADSASIIGDTLGAGGDENGFYNGGAIARFQTVHPVTGVVQNANYTIPDGTATIFAYGVAGTIDSMATVGQEPLMRSALVKGTILGISKLHASSFVTDGSRKAIGDFDLNGYDLNNVGGVYGKAAQNMFLQSYADLRLRDQWLASSVALSQDGVANPVSGSNPSICGTIYAEKRMAHALGANRRLGWWSGSLVVNDGVAVTPQIGLPSNEYYSHDGESILGNDTPLDINVNDAWAYVYMENDGSLSDCVVGAQDATEDNTIVALYYYNSGTELFTSVIDMREQTITRMDMLEVTFSTQPFMHADFDDLGRAIRFFEGLERLLGSEEGFTHMRFVLRVLGTNVISGDLHFDLSNIQELYIVGDGWAHSQLNFTSPTTADVNIFDCGGTCCLHVEDLLCKWIYATSDQGTGYGLFYGVGDYSTFERLHVTGQTQNFFNVVLVESGSATDITFRDCDFASYAACIDGVGAGTNHLSTLLIEHCLFSAGSYGYALMIPGDFNKVKDCIIISAASAVAIGHMGEVSGNYIYATSDGVAVAPFSGYSSNDLIVSIHHNRMGVGSECVVVSNGVSTTDVQISIDGNKLSGAYGVTIANLTGVGAQAAVSITNNRFDGCTSGGIAATYARTLQVMNNVFVNHSGTGVWASTGTLLQASGNYFEGFGDDSTNRPHAFYIDSAGLQGWQICNNYIGSVGVVTDAIMILAEIGQGTTSNNKFMMGGATHDGLKLYSASSGGIGHTVQGNIFSGGRSAILIDGDYSNIRDISISGNIFQNVFKFGITINKSGVITIDGNTFYNIDGCAIDCSNSADGEMVNVSDNTFHFCSGDRTDSGLSVSAVIFFDATGSNDTMSRIIGNTFHWCGNEGADSSEACHIIYVNRKAVVSNNIIYNVRGYSTNSDRLNVIRTRGTAIVQGNHINIALDTAMIAMPATIRGIVVEGVNSVVQGNILDWSTALATADYTELTGFYLTDTADASVLIGNIIVTNYSARSAASKGFWTLANCDNVYFIGNWEPGSMTSTFAGGSPHPSNIAYSANSNDPFGDFNNF